MGEVLQLQLSKTSPMQLNSCRIYLQVFHISDMIEPNGKKFKKEYITGTKSTKQTSSYKRPNQIKLSLTTWKLWIKTITYTFKLTSNYTLPNKLQLSNWIVCLNERHIKKSMVHLGRIQWNLPSRSPKNRKRLCSKY